MADINLEIAVNDRAVLNSLQSIDKSLDVIAADAKKTDAALSAAFDPSDAAKFQAQIDKLEKELASLKKTAAETEKSTDGLGRGFGRGLRSIRGLGSGVAVAANSFGELVGAGALGGAALNLVARGADTLLGSLTELILPTDKVLQQTNALASSYVEEKSQLDALFGVVQSSTASQEDKAAAIALLNKEYSDYLPAVITDQSSQEELAKAYQEVNKAIVAGIVSRAKAAEAQRLITEITQKTIQASRGEAKLAASGFADVSLAQLTLGSALGNTLEQVTGVSTAIGDIVSATNQQELAQLRAEYDQLNQTFADVEKELLKLNIDTSAAADIQGKLTEQTKATDEANKKAIATARKAAEDRRKQREKELADAVRQNLELAALEEQLRDELLLTERERLEKTAQLQAAARAEDIARAVSDERTRAELLSANERRLQSEILGIRERLATEAEQKAAEIAKRAADARLQAAQSELDAELELNEQTLRERQAIEQRGLVERGATETEFAALAKKQEEERQRLALETEIKRLQFTLEFGEARTEAEREVIQKTIAAAQAELALVGQGAATQERGGLLQRLGLAVSPDEERAAVESFKRLGGQVLSVLQEQAAQRVQIAAQVVADREANISDLRAAIDTELAANTQGFASNVEGLRRQLYEQEQLRRQALEQQAQAQRAQILLDTALQASNLITSASDIFKVTAPLNAIPGLGTAIAIGLVGAMIGAFTAAKVRALQATQVRLSEGGRIPIGRTDKNGGRGHRIEDTNVVVGGGEWVVNDEASREHNAFLQALNAGAYKGVDLAAELNGVARGVKRTQRHAQKRREQSQSRQIRVAFSKASEKMLERLATKPDYVPLPDGRIATIRVDARGGESISKRKL